MTANHREVWKELLHRPEMARMVDASADVASNSVTPDEMQFVNLVILHISSMYEALKDQVVIKQEGLRRDVGSFFALPIPKVDWEKTKVFQNVDFVSFVEKCRTGAAVLRMLQVIHGLSGRERGLG